MLAGARVPMPIKAGANCSSDAKSRPIVAACRTRPVTNLRRDARLIRQDRVLALVALARQRHRLRLRHEGRRVLNRRDDRRAVRLVVARLVAQSHVAVDVVLDAAGIALLLDLVEIGFHAAVEILLIDRVRRDHRRRCQLRLGPGGAGDSVVGQIVLSCDLNRSRDARCGVQAQGDRWRDRLVVARHVVPAGDASVLPECIQPQRAAAKPAVGRTGRERPD